MSRIPLVGKEQASPDVAAVYGVLEANFKKIPNLFATVANHPPALKPLLELFDSLYNQSSVDPRLLEFVVIKIAYGYQSHYCLTLHKAFALERGVSNDEIRRLEDPAQWGTFSDAERVLLEFTAQFQEDPLAVGDDLFTRLGEHYDRGQVVNLVMLMGLASLFGQVANALQIPVDTFLGGGEG